MPIGSGNTILAADYNSIQTTVANILGTGSGDRGYGQAVASSQVAAGNTISASHMVNLKTDLDKIAFHQNNAASSAPSVSVGGTILASDWSTYNSQSSSLDGSRFNISGSQSTYTESIAPTVPADTWGAGGVTKTHTITVTFGSANEGRYFFNAGGEIRLTPSVSGATSSTTKGGRWETLFSNVRPIRLGYTTTVWTGGSSAIGYYDLTSSDQTLYSASDGTYTNNSWNVLARCNVANNSGGTATTITITINYVDGGVQAGANFDENVDGIMKSAVGHFRATGSYVQVTAPGISGTGF